MKKKSAEKKHISLSLDEPLIYVTLYHTTVFFNSDARYFPSYFLKLSIEFPQFQIKAITASGGGVGVGKSRGPTVPPKQ